MATAHLLEQVHTNFGGVPFAIRAGTGQDVRLPGWSQTNVSATRHIPGSGRSVTFQMGRGSMGVSYTIECQRREDYEALQDLVGSTGVLQIPRRVCELPQTQPDDDGNQAVKDVLYFGRVYTRITEIILMDVGQPMPGDGDYIETTVRFQRNERPE